MKKLFSTVVGLGAAAASVAYFFKKYHDYYEQKEGEALPEELVLNKPEGSMEDEKDSEEESEEEDLEADYLNVEADSSHWGENERLLKTNSHSGTTPLETALSDSIIAISHYVAPKIILKHQIIYFDQELQNSFIDVYSKYGYEISIFQDTISLSKEFDNDLTKIKEHLLELHERIFVDFAVYKGLEIFEVQ